jgi:hypothetical protein
MRALRRSSSFWLSSSEVEMKPKEWVRARMLSMPTKAPPQMNRISVVSM